MGSSNPSKHPKPTTFTSTLSHHPTPNPDLTQPPKPSFMLKHLSSLNISHKARAPHKLSQTNHPPPPLVDTHLQAKAMTSSAIFDSSNFSLFKPNTIVAPKLDRESKPAKRPSKAKPQKCNIEMERWKLEGVMKNENKDSDREVHSRVLFEDVKVENSRMLEHDVVKGKSVSLAHSGGRRRSFCGSKVDLGDVFAVNGVKVVSADMPPFMQIHAVDYARKVFDRLYSFPCCGKVHM